MVPTRIHTLTGAEILCVSDIDCDGWDDLIYTSWDTGEVWCARNQHDGTLLPELIASGLTQARDVTTHRVLNRAQPEILVSAYRAGHFCFVNLSGVWTKFTIEALSYGASGIAAGRLNGDGLPDVVTCRQGADGAMGAVTIWKNTDSGTFQRVLDVPAHEPAGVAIGDWDGDGINDILYTDSDGLCWLRNMGGFTFAPPVRLVSGSGKCSGLKLADVNRDGQLEAVVASYDAGPLVVQANGAIQAVDPTMAFCYYVAAGAFTYPANGRVDLVAVSGEATAEVRLYRQQADGSYVAETVTAGYLTGRSCGFADLLHNGHMQIATTSYGLGAVDYWAE